MPAAQVLLTERVSRPRTSRCASATSRSKTPAKASHHGRRTGARWRLHRLSVVSCLAFSFALAYLLSSDNSYVTDPAYARYFTYGAAGLLGCGVLATLPSAGYALVNGRLGESMGLGGIVYSPSRKATSAETSDQHPLIAQRRPWSLLYASAAVNKISLRTASVRIGRFRLISGLSLGAILLAFLIPAALLSTLLPESQLYVA